MSYIARLAKLITSGDKKGQQAYVIVTNKKLDEKNETKFEVEQDRFEYPQFGVQIPVDEKGNPSRQMSDEEANQGIQEFVANAGSAVRALEIINDATRTAATNSGKAVIRTASTGSVESIIESGLRASREFTWAEEKKISAAQAKEVVTDLLASLDSLSADEIKARLLALR